MNGSGKTLRSSTFYGLVAAALVGACAIAALVLGLSARTTLPRGVANGSGLLVFALLAYPAFQSLAEVRDKRIVSFARWALVWVVSAALVAIIVHPLVERLLK